VTAELELLVAELPGVGVADVVTAELDLLVVELPGVGVADVTAEL
jgi:hypothetical protein